MTGDNVKVDPDNYYAWANASNISANDNQYASISFDWGSGGVSDYLQGTNFGFTIPSTAIIDGIELTVSRFSEVGVHQNARDVDIHLVKAGAIAGINKGFPYHQTDWPATETTITYGGPTDLWGTTWTPADINASNFGAAITAQSGDPISAFVDYMQITVTYTHNATTLTASAVSGTYGNTVSLSATLSPVLPGRLIDFSLNGAPACSGATNTSGTATCSAALAANAGTYPAGVSAHFAGETPYGESTGTASLVVAPRPITVTAVNSTKVYDGNTSSTGTPLLTSGTLVFGQTATWSQAYNNKNIGTGKTLIPSGAVSDGNGGNNYSVTFVNATNGVISKLAITVTAVSSSKTYDGTTASTGTPSISPALAPGDTPNFIQVFDSRNAGTGKTLIPSGAVNDGNGGNNYAVTYVNSTSGVIQKLGITVTAAAKSKVYGSPDPSLTYSTNPALIVGDVLEGSLSRVAGESVGVYPIQQGTLNGGVNYTITLFTGASLTITRAPQSITVTTHAPEMAVVGSSFTVAASSSSGLQVAFSASGGCSNAGPVFTMASSPQNCTVHFNQPGNSNYYPASEVVETVQAAYAPVITAPPVSARVLSGQDAVFRADISAFPLPVYQWQVSTDGGITFSDLAGEESSTLVIHSPDPSSNGFQYRVIITNAYGSVVTDPVSLNLLYNSLFAPIVIR